MGANLANGREFGTMSLSYREDLRTAGGMHHRCNPFVEIIQINFNAPSGATLDELGSP
jgi:hypothetical protein